MARLLFAVWAAGVFLFLLFGRGTCFLCCFGGDGNLLIYRSAWLVFKGPNNKKDQTAKQKKTNGFRLKWLYEGWARAVTGFSVQGSGFIGLGFNV